ncbi:Hypothetical protein Minf_1971 [Methylacidiphilum infernorum V4]|uniref:Uncharacterized protein n=1 Tax=Methylacidiphilum infernorum (isolate V4) TaxID=481448 RepID=B3DYH7_METI4|nr:Hypothetical protein Minf_1971 [Methylacidiphilum infernorum V4]
MDNNHDIEKEDHLEQDDQEMKKRLQGHGNYKKIIPQWTKVELFFLSILEQRP